MKKILFILAILLPMGAWAQLFNADITVNGSKKTAEFVVSGTDECKLGSGWNACISQYSEGFVSIPQEVSYNGKTYKVKEINNLAFRLCSKITSVNIPEGVTRVGEFAFQGCQSLAELDLCTTLKTIGSGAFIDLPSLRMVKLEATTPPTWEYNDVFRSHKDGIATTESVKYSITVLHVPDAAKEAYKNSKFSKPEIGWNTAEGWANFQTIEDSHGATLRITSAADLKGFRDAVNTGAKYKKVVLEADIDMRNEAQWDEPIGKTPEYAFTSIFDGQGHTISGLKVNYVRAALFGCLKGAKIVNLNLTNGYFDGKIAGSLCAETVEDESGTSYTTIDSVMVKKCEVLGNSYGGGLIGEASMVNVDRTVVMNTNVYVTYSDAFLSGLLGYVKNGTANNVAVIEGDLKNVSSAYKGAFLGGCKRYAVYNSFTTHELGVGVYDHLTDDNCVYKDKDYEYKNERGETRKEKFKPSTNETFFFIQVLGLSDWVYCPNEYPLPACFEDSLPAPKANVMTLRPRSLSTDRINGLSIAEGDEKTIKWNDFSSGTGSFLSTAKFTTSRLWVDGKLTGSVLKGELPIGKTTITAHHGVKYDVTLNAKEVNDVFEFPDFKVDDKGYIVVGDDGNPIINGYTEIEYTDYESVAYPLFLPYQTTLPVNCIVYKPVKLASDENGVATIELERVNNNQTDAFKPYFVLINSGDLTLGTTHEVVINPHTGSSISLGTDYEFAGTMYAVDKNAAIDNHFYLKNADDYAQWNVMTDENKKDVEAFSAYFRAKGTKTSKILLTMEHVSDANFEYEMLLDESENDVLYITKYKGEGGDIVVPATVTAKVGGTERTMSVVDIDDDVFEKMGDKIRSIDLSQCKDLYDFYVDRKMNGNPFHGVKETALIFMPKDNGSVGVNVVVGDQCQKLLLKEGQNFYSPRDFKAKKVEYKRAMAANTKYSICLPYSAPMLSGLKYYELKEISGGTLQFTEVTQTKPGVPYLVATTSAIDNFDYNDANHNGAATDIVSKVGKGSSNGEYTMYGTFEYISPAEIIGKYILQPGGKWLKSKTENPNVYLSPFRAYLLSTDGSGDTGSEIDSEFTGIRQIHTTDLDGTEHWYDLNGHPINGTPSKKGVYIRQGKKIVLH